MKFGLTICIILCIGAYNMTAQNKNIADSFYYTGNYNKAINLYTALLQEKNDYSDKEISELYNRKANCLSLLQNNNEAILNHFESLKYAEKAKESSLIAKACFNLSNIYYNIKDYNNCEKYLVACERFYLKLNDSARMVKLLSLKSLLYNDTRGSREAIDIRLYAMKNYQKYFDDFSWQELYFNLGYSYSLFQPDSALLYYEKCLALWPKTNDSSYLGSIYSNVGYIYLEKKNVNQANKYLHLALATDYLSGDSSQTKNLYDNVARFYYETGAYKKSYEYAEKARLIGKALYNKDKSTVVAELSEKYEAEKKDATIIQQQKENKNKTKGLIAIGVGLGLVTVLAAFSYWQYRKKERANALLEKQNDAIQHLNQQLQEANQTKISLFSIISHDLRAPLSSLYALLQTQNLKQQQTGGNYIVARHTENLLDTLENLLLWSKTQLEQFKINIAPVNLVNTFKEVEQLYNPVITSKKIVIQHDVTGAGMIQTDQDVLNIICRNIYSNALQNALPGSTVIIRHQLYPNLHIAECTNYYDSSKTNDTVFFSERGLGTTLIKDFCTKINSTVHFSSGEQQFTVLLKVPTIITSS
jgi:tetratricopeptide (TPR) repeat protein